MVQLVLSGEQAPIFGSLRSCNTRTDLSQRFENFEAKEKKKTVYLQSLSNPLRPIEAKEPILCDWSRKAQYSGGLLSGLVWIVWSSKCACWQDKIIQTNPILEAFGNAMTARNQQWTSIFATWFLDCQPQGRQSQYMLFVAGLGLRWGTTTPPALASGIWALAIGRTTSIVRS